MAQLYLNEKKYSNILKNFKKNCLMKNIENLNQFCEQQTHVNFFDWATVKVILFYKQKNVNCQIESTKNAYLQAVFKTITGKQKYFQTTISQEYREKYDIRLKKNVQAKLSSNHSLIYYVS